MNFYLYIFISALFYSAEMFVIVVDYNKPRKQQNIESIYYGSQWDQKRSVYWYSSKYQKIGWIHLKTVKPKCLTSGVEVKWAYFQKKWSIPLILKRLFNELVSPTPSANPAGPLGWKILNASEWEKKNIF